MSQFGFRSVFSKLFASVMMTLVIFAIAMMTLTHLVHDNSANTRWQVLAKQITNQIDPFLSELNTDIAQNNRLQARFTLAVIKKSFDIFDESLHAKLGLYDSQGHLLVQTNNSDLPKLLPDEPSWLSRMLPSFSNEPVNNSVQSVSKNGFTLLYESREPPKRTQLSAAFNLLTGTILLLIIMTIMLWWISRSMTWRINQMSKQMGQLGEGNFSVRVPEQGTDEIASLAHGFNQAAQKIEQLINANNLLLAHASHELRTPITRIRLQVEMMDMLAAGLPAETKQKFDKRAQAINRDLTGLNDLVESILLVSRLDAGHAVQQNERFDIYELINQECQHYTETIFCGEHIVMQGQPKLLIHLIRNLLNNALIHGKPPIIIQLYGVMKVEEAFIPPHHILNQIDSSDKKQSEQIEDKLAKADDMLDPKDNCFQQDDDPDFYNPAKRNDSDEPVDLTVTLNSKNNLNNQKTSTTNTSTTKASTTSTSTINAPIINDKGKPKATILSDNRFTKRLRNKTKPSEQQPKYAVLAVIDQGRGIATDKRKDIFSPFVRLQQQKKGSGLGLSLVAQIVNAHNGHISTDTYEGHTRFIVILPTSYRATLPSNEST